MTTWQSQFDLAVRCGTAVPWSGGSGVDLRTTVLLPNGLSTCTIWLCERSITLTSGNEDS